MESIKEYLITVISAALIVGIFTNFIDEKSSHGRLIRIVGGLIVVFAVISPWAQLRIEDISAYYRDFDRDARTQAEQGSQMAQQALSGIIKSQTEAYILEKASSMDIKLQVNVLLSNGAPPEPSGVELRGDISPHAKKQLTRMIQEDLGIPEEQQIWT